MKRCFKCHRDLALDQFYRHEMTGDGLLGKCKDCTKRDVARRRMEKLEEVRAYDRARAKLPHRRANARSVTKRWRKTDRRRAQAQTLAQRHHRKAPVACQNCGLKKRLERHHPDYDFPLLIIWVCKPCHALLDKARREKEKAK